MKNAAPMRVETMLRGRRISSCTAIMPWADGPSYCQFAQHLNRIVIENGLVCFSRSGCCVDPSGDLYPVTMVRTVLIDDAISQRL